MLSSPPGSINVPCRYHAQGNCRHGAQCPFRHDVPAAPAASQPRAESADKKTKKKRSRSRKPKGGGDAPAAPAVLRAIGQTCAAAAVRFTHQQCGLNLEGTNHGPIRWLADTGCAADLIGLHDMTRDDLEVIEQTPEPVCFSSANGPVWATSTLPLQGTALLEEMNPYVMEQTPAVLSIGRRCMKEGFSFHWPANTSPYFITPNGKKIVCEVHAYVPYLTQREPIWAERAAAAPAVAGLPTGQP